MNFDDLKIAIIGDGRWAQNHKSILKERGCLAGVFDIETDYHFELSRGYDGVVIATDPVMHFPISLEAIEQGVAVYCEKPIATKLYQLGELRLKIIHKPYQAGFQLLYDPDINRMRVDGVEHFISRRLGGNYRNESVVQTLMIHDIAVMMYLYGGKADDYQITESWGERSEVNVNFELANKTTATMHARYGRPHFRQMDFINHESERYTDSFDNHKQLDLLALSVEDWLTAIKDPEHKNRVNLDFALNVQELAFKVDLAVGIDDSTRGEDVRT